MEIKLREMIDDDLPIIFAFEQEPEANWMAAFTAKDPADYPAFLAHWAKVRADPGITLRTILADGQVAGSISCHSWFGDPEITYWIGQAYWGKGIASQSLAEFLKIVTVRPLYGRAVKDNVTSIRVMEKCGFTRHGEGKGFANARQAEVEEVILVLV